MPSIGEGFPDDRLDRGDEFTIRLGRTTSSNCSATPGSLGDIGSGDALADRLHREPSFGHDSDRNIGFLSPKPLQAHSSGSRPSSSSCRAGVATRAPGFAARDIRMLPLPRLQRPSPSAHPARPACTSVRASSAEHRCDERQGSPSRPAHRPFDHRPTSEPSSIAVGALALSGPPLHQAISSLIRAPGQGISSIRA